MIDGDEKGGDIAVSAEDFGVLADQIEVDLGEEPGAPIAATDGEYGFDFGVFECPMEVVESFLIGTSEIGPGAHEVRGIDGDEAEGFNAGAKCGEVFGGSDRGSGGDEGNLVSGFEGLGRGWRV